jgi:hypothetical protein
MKNKFLATAIILSFSQLISAAEHQHPPMHQILPQDMLDQIINHTGFTSVEQLILWKETLRKPLTIDLHQKNVNFILKILEKAKEWNVNITLKLVHCTTQHLTQIANDANASQIIALDLSNQYHGTSAFFPQAMKEIEKLTNLETLNLSDNTIHWSTMNYLNNEMPGNFLPKLKELNLSHTNAGNIEILKAAFKKTGNHEIKITI